MQVEVLQRQLDQAMNRYFRSSQDRLDVDRRPVDSVERDDEARRRLEDALNEAEKQLLAERQRSDAAERQQAAAVDRSASLLADKDATLSQLSDRLTTVEQQLADQVDRNTKILDELNTCRADKVDLQRHLELEKAKTAELEADVEHLRADLADVTELRGLETTNRLLREDLERVESRLKLLQLDNSQLQETRTVSEATIQNLKLELEATTSTLKQKDGNVRNLEETARTLRAEIGDLKNSLTQAENLAARTQTELVAVNSTLKDELANSERLKRRVSDETTKSQKLEKTVVDLYSELESKDSEFETEARNSRIFRQQIEAKLHVSEEDGAKLKDLLRDAEKKVEELEEQLKARGSENEMVEMRPDSATGSNGTRQEMAEGLEQSDTVATVLDVSVSAEAPSAGVVTPSDGDKLRERYAVAVRRMQSVQRDLRHAEARQAELEDTNALLRRQLTNVDSNREETTAQLTTQVDQLTAQLDTAETHLQQLKVCLSRSTAFAR